MTAAPHAPAHRTSPGDLARMQVALGSGGVRFGTGAGGPVTVRLFRSRPTQLALVTTRYLARVLAFRALAVGATVEIGSTYRTGWEALLGLQPPERISLVPPQLAVGSGPGARPVLRCEEVMATALTPRADLVAGQAVAMVCPDLRIRSVPSLAAFDVVALQRVPAEVLAPLQRTFGLADGVLNQLAVLPADAVLLLAAGRAAVTSLALTPVELSVLGPPTSS